MRPPRFAPRLALSSRHLVRHLVLWAPLAACSGAAVSSAPCPASDAGALGADAGASDGSPAAAPDASDAAAPGASGAAAPGASDAAPDATGPAPLAFPDCVGAPAPLTLSTYAAYAKVDVGAAPGALSGQFLLDFGSTFSAVDLSAFAAPGPAASGCDPQKLGQPCQFAGFDFFGAWGTVTLVTEDFASLAGSVRQAGIVGTDFLSVHAATLDYAGARVLVAPGTAMCADADLLALGMVPLSSAGFYSNDLGQLRPLTDVQSDAPTDAGASFVPNVPTVKLRVGGVEALAQLDTGFNDTVVRHSINVNDAFLSAIQAKDATALVRAAALDLTLSTCVVGVSEPVAAYRVAPGHTVDFVAEDGTAARAEPDAVLFVKHTPQAARACGGIGAWTVPAAQVGASFYADAGAVVFDAPRSRVWLPKR